MTASPRSVVAVIRNPDRMEFLEALAESSDYDVVVVTSVAGAYSCIKQNSPQLIVLFLEFDDPSGYQLLSSLGIDAELSRIPLITCPIPREVRVPEEIVEELVGYPAPAVRALEKN